MNCKREASPPGPSSGLLRRCELQSRPDCLLMLAMHDMTPATPKVIALCSQILMNHRVAICVSCTLDRNLLALNDLGIRCDDPAATPSTRKWHGASKRCTDR